MVFSMLQQFSIQHDDWQSYRIFFLNTSSFTSISLILLTKSIFSHALAPRIGVKYLFQSQRKELLIQPHYILHISEIHFPTTGIVDLLYADNLISDFFNFGGNFIDFYIFNESTFTSVPVSSLQITLSPFVGT